jgi:hypothetical protein
MMLTGAKDWGRPGGPGCARCDLVNRLSAGAARVELRPTRAGEKSLWRGEGYWMTSNVFSRGWPFFPATMGVTSN